jgi:hypothetical protein
MLSTVCKNPSLNYDARAHKNQARPKRYAKYTKKYGNAPMARFSGISAYGEDIDLMGSEIESRYLR